MKKKKPGKLKCFLFSMIVFGMAFSSVPAYANESDPLPEVKEEFPSETQNDPEETAPETKDTDNTEEEIPSEITPTPNAEEEIPSDSAPVPGSEEESPSENTPAPGSEEESPSDSTPVPGSEEENPADSTQAPDAEEEIPSGEKKDTDVPLEEDSKTQEELEESGMEEEEPKAEEAFGLKRLLGKAAEWQSTRPFKTREASAILDVADESSRYDDPLPVTLYEILGDSGILPVSGAYADAMVSDITSHLDSMGFYTGSEYEELAESCLYTFTGSGTQWKIQAKADGRDVYLNPGGGSAGFPNTEAAATCTVADQPGGVYIRSGSHFLWYFASGVDRSGNRCYFDRATSNVPENTTMHLYRRAGEGDSEEAKEASLIQGYIPLSSVSELESGSQYLVAVHTTDGAVHLLRPSYLRNNKAFHVLDLEGALTVYRGSVSVVPKAVGAEDLIVADTTYHVQVIDSTPHKNPREPMTMDVYVMPGETVSVIDETQSFTMHDSDDTAEITLTGRAVEKTDALARLSVNGDDREFLGQKVFASDLLYTFTRTSASGNGFYITSTLPDGTPVSLFPGNNEGFPNREGTFTVTMSDGSVPGTFRFYSRSYLDYFPSTHLFTRTSASTQNPFHIYAVDETSTGPIPGYRQLQSYAELTNGQYLIAAEEPDGSLYLLHPSLSSQKRDNVARLTNETAVYETGTTEGEIRGINGGETSFTAGSTVYDVHVPVIVTMDNYEESFFRSDKKPLIEGETNYLTHLHLSPLMTYTPGIDGTLLHVQSGDEDVITVNERGTVTAVNNGSTFLSATVRRPDGSVCSYALPVSVEGETYTPSQCRLINYYISQVRNTIATMVTPKPDGNGNLVGTEVPLLYGEVFRYYVPASDPYGVMLLGRPIDEDYVLTELGSSNSSKNYEKFSESDNIVYCSAYAGQGAANFGNLYGINTRLKNPDDPLARYLSALREDHVEGMMYFTRPIGVKGSVDSDLRFNAEIKQIEISTAPVYMKHQGIWQSYDEETAVLHSGDAVVFAVTLAKPKYAVPVDISQAISFYRNVSHGPIVTEHLSNAQFIFNSDGERTVTLEDLEAGSYIEQGSVYLTQEAKDELVPLDAQTLTFYVLYQTTQRDEGTRIRQEVDLDYEFYSKYAHGTISNLADAQTVIVVPSEKSYLPSTGSWLILPYELTGVLLMLAGLFLIRTRKNMQ